jgi:hypothetical protein
VLWRSSDRDADGHAQADRNRNRVTLPDTSGHSDANVRSDGGFDAHPDRYSNRSGNGDSNFAANCDRHWNTNCDAKPNAFSHACLPALGYTLAF